MDGVVWGGGGGLGIFVWLFPLSGEFDVRFRLFVCLLAFQSSEL